MTGCSGNTSSGDGEDHQTKTSQEYSTEYGGCRSRTRFVSHNVHPPPLKQVQEHEIGQKQHHEDFAAVQIEEAEGEGGPGDGAERQSSGEPLAGAFVNGRAEANFFGEVIGKKREKKKGEARPLRRRQPGFVEREFQPSAEQEKQNQSAEEGSEQSRFPARKLHPEEFRV